MKYNQKHEFKEQFLQMDQRQFNGEVKNQEYMNNIQFEEEQKERLRGRLEGKINRLRRQYEI